MNRLWIQRVWKRSGLLGWAGWLLLLPFSCLFFLLTEIRNVFYSLGCLRAKALGRPVISVGNLTVGGTGKTPTTLWLAQRLKERGLKVGILSRGYKRKESEPVILHFDEKDSGVPSDEADVAAAGDEPAMMARIYRQTVSVCADRFRAGQALLAAGDVDVLILDDGFQHRRLKRDVDLVLLGESAVETVLPSGPFREGMRSLRRADCFLLTGAQDRWMSRVQKYDRVPAFRGQIQAMKLLGFEKRKWREHPLGLLSRNKILAVTGIADPSRVYETIHEWEGEVADTLEFPDHHVYTVADWQRINRAARHLDLIITTEKDILKLVRFPFARDKLYALRAAMVIENEDSLLDAVIEKMRRAGWQV